MKAQQILDRIEYRPKSPHCFTEAEVIQAMKKYAKQKCREQRELLEEHLQKKANGSTRVPAPYFD